MFYQGSLQDGISTAVGLQKLVLCFVTDEGEESTQWEAEFLSDEALSNLIENHAIALRLRSGSEEAGYLAQIFPLPRTPTVVVINNGELKEYITPGTSKEDFLRRVQNAFDPASHSPPSTNEQLATASTAAAQPDSEAVGTPSQGPPVSDEPTASSDHVRRILAERAARLQAEKKEEAERQAKEKRAKSNENTDNEAAARIDTDNARAHKQAETIRKRRQHELEERRRILKRIEDDKAERRLRAMEREKQRVKDLTGGDMTATPAGPGIMSPSTAKRSDLTALQVRLFDGSTLRSRFKTDSPLREIRKWVDENRADGSQPYTFKQVLTPLPNKNIDETEEDRGLGELGLSPSSTLVLIPVTRYSSAYGRSPTLFSTLVGLFLSFFTWVIGLLRSGEARGTVSGSTAVDEAPGSSPEQSRIRGFRNPNDQRGDQQLYNGNSLNFEPRPDGEDEKSG